MLIVTPSQTSTLRPCWHCTSFAGIASDGSHTKCCQRGRLSLQAAPSVGWAFWQREVGADDEPGPPAANGARSTQQVTVTRAHVAWAA